MSDDKSTPRPTLLDRAISVFSPTTALDRAIAREKLTLFGYDGGNPGTKRGSSGGLGKNASSESGNMARDRAALMWDARDLERNMPILRCVLDRMTQYVCGRIVYQPRTGDPALDSLYKLYFENWAANHADITGRHDFGMLISLAFRAMLRDGDHGLVLVRNGNALSLQSIEADRIGDPYKVGANLNENYTGGITINEFGQPLTYDIFKRTKNNTYSLERTVDAKDFIHLFNPSRSDEYRGVTWLCAVLAQARDLYEMFAFERGAAKWAASYAGVIKTQTGGPLNRANSASSWDGTSRDANGTPTSVVEQNKLLRLKEGEDVSVFNTGNRPSGAFIAYIDASLRDISMGLNVPFGFFDMRSFGGATVRLETQQLQRSFQRFQSILMSKALNRIKDAVIANGIAMGEIPATKDWRYGRWSFGRFITADVGYQTDADVQMLSNGLKSASEIITENSDQGEDYEDIIEQLAKEAQVLHATAVKYDVPVELITGDRFPTATDMLANLEAAKLPPPPSDVSTLDPKSMGEMMELIGKAASGEIPRENVITALVDLYHVDPAVAAAIVPEKQAAAVDGADQAAPPPKKVNLERKVQRAFARRLIME